MDKRNGPLGNTDASGKMLDIVRQAISRRNEGGPDVSDIFVVGCSGGPDSMALLDMLVRLGYGIFVVHIEHGIRGAASVEDARFVADWCETHEMACEIVRYDVPAIAAERKKGLEETARELRMKAFARIADRLGAKAILTAHHGDDRNETVLHHFLRGSGVHGLSGIREQEGTYTRPFLGVSKAEILDYLESNGIEYRIDESNADTRFTRNAIRNEILPMIEGYFPEYRKSLGRMSEYFGLLEDFLTGFSDEWLAKQWAEKENADGKPRTESFRVKEFAALHPFAQKEVLYAIFVRVNGNAFGVSKTGIEELLRYVLTANGGTKKRLGKLLLTKRSGVVEWRRDEMI